MPDYPTLTGAESLPSSMTAQVIHRFGGGDELVSGSVPVPAVGPTDVLIRVESAGVGSWDREERAGHYDGVFGVPSTFPYILGWDGAGTVATVGDEVTTVGLGDRVYAASTPVPRGGFYAEYAVVDEAHVAAVPDSLDTASAGALGWDALTALSGIEALDLHEGQSLLILGASGGIGHLALQFAQRAGVRVLAIASGADGVALARALGAEGAIDGRSDDIQAAARAFSPSGVDGALTTVGGEAAARAFRALRPGGVAAWPNGVTPAPVVPAGVESRPFDGDRSAPALARLNEIVNAGPFVVHLARTFPFSQVRDAHDALESHFIGKIALVRDDAPSIEGAGR